MFIEENKAEKEESEVEALNREVCRGLTEKVPSEQRQVRESALQKCGGTASKCGATSKDPEGTVTNGFWG